MARWKDSLCCIILSIAAALPLAGMEGVQNAGATSTACTFHVTSKTLTLKKSCTTSETIKVPDGDTLNGDGHTITATDPSSGPFKGAIITNAGAKATIEDVTLDGAFTNTNPKCKSYLAGISMTNTVATIKNTTVEDINRGPDSTCSGGDGIDISNSLSTPKDATVKDDTILNFAGTGIYLGGYINGTVEKNTLSAYTESASAGACFGISTSGSTTNSGPQSTISNNQLTLNCSSPNDEGCSGISLYTARSDNTISDNTVDGTCSDEHYVTSGIFIFETSDSFVSNNTVDFSSSSSSGIAIWDQGSAAPSNGNGVSGNTILNSPLGVTVITNYEASTISAPEANNNGVSNNAINDPSMGEDGVYIYECSGEAQACETDDTTVGGNTITCYNTDVLDEGTDTNNEGNTDDPCSSTASDRQAAASARPLNPPSER